MLENYDRRLSFNSDHKIIFLNGRTIVQSLLDLVGQDINIFRIIIIVTNTAI